MHRFYVFHSLSHFHRNAIAAAALFLAAKVEEQPRKLEHVIKMAHMCLHRDQPPPDIRSEQYLEQAQDLVFNENVLLQTLGFDVAIDHPHTHVVRCCQLVKASKDLAQTSYFMASNSLHLTTMCLQYKPTVVACFCIHLACKWSNWEIPQSTEGKHWFWYVDKSVTSELLQELTAEFLHIFDKCPSRLKRKIMSISANQSPSINHPSLPNSPFDAEPRKVQSPATTADGGPTFHASRPHHTEKQEDKKQIAPAPSRPPVDYREYREKKERERIEREKTTVPTTVPQSHASDINKHHSHHHKPVSSTNVLNKHPLPLGQKALHHNHHHRPEVKVGQPVPQRHSSSTQAREPNRDPNRQRLQREYNSSTGTSSSSNSSSTLHSHSHTMPKDPNLDNSLTDSTTHRPDVATLQDPVAHGNMQEKLSNNNHSVHRISGIENKHQGHDKRMYDPRHKPVEHRKDNEQKPYKYPDPTRVERQRKSDTLEQRCEEVRKLIEKPLPPPKPTLDVPYASNTQKPPHHTKYNQSEKLQTSSGSISTDAKLTTAQSSFTQEKSPTSSSSASLLAQKSLTSKTVASQHTAHGVSQILKDTIKNGSSQSSSLSSLNNLDDPKTEKRPRYDDPDKSDMQQSALQTPPGKPKSLFSPEKVPTLRESHSQRPKSKQKTPPSAAKVPKQERVPDTSIGFNLVSPFASPPGLQQPETPSVKRSASDVSTTSHKRHRAGSTSDSGQQAKVKMEDTSSFEAVKMLGRVPELIQPIRDNPSANGRATQIANDMKPPELIKPFDAEPTISRFGPVSTQQQMSNQQGLTNGMDANLAVKQESQEFQIKKEPYKSDMQIKMEHSQIKSEYLSPMKSAQSISALLQEPLAPLPSLLQNVHQFSQITPQQMHQEQYQQQQLQQQQAPQQQQSISHSMLLTDNHGLVQNPSMSLPIVNEPVIASTVDISAFSEPVQTSTESVLPVPTSTTVTPVPPAEEKRSEHRKSEKKKKKEKHKHKDKEKTKEKHKHKHKDKDKEKHREKDKEKGEETVTAVPIKITIPKDKLNLSTESTASTGAAASTEKNKSPQNTSIKIIIPKERLKGTDNVSSSPAQPVVQAPLKIKIRTDGISRSSAAAPSTTSSSSIVPEFSSESRKRERSDPKENPLANTPATKKQSQVSSAGYGQHRPGERQNGRHYSSGSNNKILKMNYSKSLRPILSCLSECNFESFKRGTLIKNVYRSHHYSCKVLVVGGGTGGCTMAAKFANTFKDPKKVIIVEPSQIHYYQPMFTLIGGDIRSFDASKKPMKEVLPKDATWLQENVMSFEPEQNQVTMSNGDTVQYEIMIVAVGLQLHWEKIPGLVKSLQDGLSQVCSIYGADTVPNVYSKISRITEGNAIFTFPNSPVKCPGAPQKILYIAEEFFRKKKVRGNIRVVYNTSLPVIFGVKKYADALWKVCERRDINVNLQTNLIEIDPTKQEAVFQKLDGSNETFVEKFSLLHVCPPMGAPDILKKHPSLTNEAGFLSVDSKTLRHTKYSNIYGIGDCTSTPNSKTMAAIAAQGKVLYKNIMDDMAGKPMTMAYNGYSSCPLVTGYRKCILAEFDYNLQPMETFPVNQSREYFFTFLLKAYAFPLLYWNLMLRGHWDGPEFFRKYSELIKSKEKSESPKS
nr:PREDICTED: cyclin-T-like isoform X1 [Megachile rotundata]